MKNVLPCDLNHLDYSLAGRIANDNQFCMAPLLARRLDAALHASHFLSEPFIPHRVFVLVHPDNTEDDQVIVSFDDVLGPIHPGFQQHSADQYG